MNLKRHSIFAGIALTATLTLAACGSDNTGTDSPGASGTNPPAGITCANGSLTAQGSSAQKNAMDEWIKAYQQACADGKINYTASGSSAGKKAFSDGTADFAGSDSVLKDGDETTKANARCVGGQAIHLPMVVGPIAVAYNVEGVTNLQLSSPTLAKIFMGQIKTWDAAEIKADNPSATLPSLPILTIHRSEGSGTTENFTDYLNKTSPEIWTQAKSSDWKGGPGQGESGSSGVAGAVKRSPGSIGYVEWSFAKTNQLGVAKIKNGAGEFVELTGDAAGKAVAGAKVTGTGDDLKLSVDYKTTEAGAYPIILVTYEIACSKGNPADKVAVLKGFFGWTASAEGQKSLDKIGYAPLPDSVRTKVATAVTNMA